MAGYKTNRVEIKEQDYLSEEQKRRAREEERKAAERSAALEKGIEELDVKEFLMKDRIRYKEFPNMNRSFSGKRTGKRKMVIRGSEKVFLKFLRKKKQRSRQGAIKKRICRDTDRKKEKNQNIFFRQR